MISASLHQPNLQCLSCHHTPRLLRRAFFPALRSLTRSVISVVFVVSTALASTLIATATFLVANQSATTVTACAIATTALAAAALTAVILLAAAFAAAIIAPATAGATVATTIRLLLIRRSFGEFRRHRCATYIQAWARGRETRLVLHWRSGNLRWKMQYLGWLTSRPAAAALDAATAAAARTALPLPPSRHVERPSTTTYVLHLPLSKPVSAAGSHADPRPPPPPPLLPSLPPATTHITYLPPPSKLPFEAGWSAAAFSPRALSPTPSPPHDRPAPSTLIVAHQPLPPPTSTSSR